MEIKHGGESDCVSLILISTRVHDEDGSQLKKKKRSGDEFLRQRRDSS